MRETEKQEGKSMEQQSTGESFELIYKNGGMSHGIEDKRVVRCVDGNRIAFGAQTLAFVANMLLQCGLQPEDIESIIDIVFMQEYDENGNLIEDDEEDDYKDLIKNTPEWTVEYEAMVDSLSSDEDRLYAFREKIKNDKDFSGLVFKLFLSTMLS